MGPEVNETADEKCNLPLSIISAPPIARLPPPPLLSGLYHGGLVFGGNGVAGGRWWWRRRVSKDDEFLIFLTFTCPTRDWHGLCRFGIVSDPGQPPSRTPDSVYHITTCSPADPCGPARYLKPPSAGPGRMWRYEELPRLIWTLRAFQSFCSLFSRCWRVNNIRVFLIVNVRYFKRAFCCRNVTWRDDCAAEHDLWLSLPFKCNVFVHLFFFSALATRQGQSGLNILEKVSVK